MRGKTDSTILKKGIYQTRSGRRAIVQKVLPTHKHFWVFKGFIDIGGKVLAMHTWNIYGNSVSGNSNLDLIWR